MKRLSWRSILQRVEGRRIVGLWYCPDEVPFQVWKSGSRNGILSIVITQNDDRLARRISELTEWLIAHVPDGVTVDGPRGATEDRAWRLKDADGWIVHVLRVTELALDGERDLGKDLTQQQWLDRWGESRCFRLRSDGLLERCPVRGPAVGPAVAKRSPTGL